MPIQSAHRDVSISTLRSEKMHWSSRALENASDSITRTTYATQHFSPYPLAVGRLQLAHPIRDVRTAYFPVPFNHFNDSTSTKLLPNSNLVQWNISARCAAGGAQSGGLGLSRGYYQSTLLPMCNDTIVRTAPVHKTINN
jgi:hypothetical protein